jgi:hypothetical protein
VSKHIVSVPENVDVPESQDEIPEALQVFSSKAVLLHPVGMLRLVDLQDQHSLVA